MSDSRPGKYRGRIDVVQSDGGVLVTMFEGDATMDGADVALSAECPVLAELNTRRGTWTGPPPAEGDEVRVNTRTVNGVESMDVEVIHEPLTDEEKARIDMVIDAMERSL